MRFHDLLNKPKKIKESKAQQPATNAKSYEQRLQEKLKESMGIK